MRRTHHNRRWIHYALTTGLGVSTALTTAAVMAQQPDQAPAQADAAVQADAELQTDDAQPQAGANAQADVDAQADADAQPDAPPQPATDAPAAADAQPPSPPAESDAQADAQASADASPDAPDAPTSPDAPAAPDAPQPPSEAGAQSQLDAQGQLNTQGQLNAEGQASLQAQSQGADQAGQQARLGIRMTDMNDMVVVEQVMPGSAAAQAGLQAGDRIVSVNGQRFNGSQQLVTLVQGQNPGDMLDIVVLRDGQEQRLQATLAAWQGAQRDQRYSVGRVDVGQQDRVAQLEARLQRLEAEVQMLRQQSMNQPAPGATIQPGAAGFEADADFGAGAAINPPAAPAAGDVFNDGADPLENRLRAGAPDDADDPSPETGKARLPD